MTSDPSRQRDLHDRQTFSFIATAIHVLIPEPGIRRDLRASALDALAFSVMVGCGETYLPAFALALGFGPVAAGLVATIPLLAGAIAQLITPLAVVRLGTNRGWVVACASLQALSFVPFVYWAIRGESTMFGLLVAASLYWGAGMATAPAWNAWIGEMVPDRIRVHYFARRNRLSQAGVLAGFVFGGVLLQIGQRYNAILPAFAIVFVVAACFRLASAVLLASYSEPVEHRPTPLITELRTSGSWSLAWLVRSGPGMLVTYLWGVTAAAQFSGPYFTPFMLKELDFSYGTFMLIVSTSFAAKMFAIPTLGRFASRVGSMQLLRIGGLSIVPLSAFWILSSNISYLLIVQTIAGACWAAYELAVCLLFFDAVTHKERTATVTSYNLGLAIATVAGATTGGMLLRWLGEDRSAYFALFGVSAVLRLVTVPLLYRLISHEHSRKQIKD